MKGLRLLNNGEWNKSPVLLAARRLLISGLGEHFPKRSLGESAVFLNGTSYEVGQVNEFGAAPIIRISNITDPTSDYIRTGEHLDKKFWISAGDLLVSWSASFKSTIWPGPEGYLNQHIFKVTEREGFDRRYIRHAIEASFDELQENVVGIGMMHLRRADFLGHPIPAPPLKTQIAVADYLDFIESDENTKRPTLPEVLTKQQRMLSRIEEVAARIHEARTLRHLAAKEAEALMESWSRRILGTLEKSDWKLNPLHSICSVFIDCDHKTPDYLEEGIPLLRPRDIKPENLSIAGTVRISEAEHEKRCERHRPVEGDIVYSRELSFGNAAMIPGGCVVSLGQGTMLVRANETKVEKRFLLKALNAPVVRKQAAKAAKGAAHPHVNLKDIRMFGVPVPPLPEQRRIVAELDALQAEVDALKRLQVETAAELDALLPSVLDKAFKGEL